MIKEESCQAQASELILQIWWSSDLYTHAMGFSCPTTINKIKFKDDSKLIELAKNNLCRVVKANTRVRKGLWDKEMYSVNPGNVWRCLKDGPLNRMGTLWRPFVLVLLMTENASLDLQADIGSCLHKRRRDERCEMEEGIAEAICLGILMPWLCFHSQSSKKKKNQVRMRWSCQAVSMHVLRNLWDREEEIQW